MKIDKQAVLEVIKVGGRRRRKELLASDLISI